MILNKKILGTAAGLLAAVTYGLNPLFALPLQAEGMGSVTILFYRYLLAIPVVGVMMVVRGRSFHVRFSQGLMLLLMGVLMGLSSLLLFESYTLMDAGIASTLLFVYPLMVALIMAAGFSERLSPLTWICLVGTTIGIFLLYSGEGGNPLNLFGTAMVMGSALCYALYIVGVNKSSLASLPTLTVTFYCLFAGLTVFIFPILTGETLGMPVGEAQWLRLLALAFFPTAVSLMCTTLAIAYVGSTVTAILGAMEPVTAVVIGVTVFQEHLTAKDVCGLLLIVVFVSLVVVGSSLGHLLTSIRKMLPSGKSRKR